eukprot:contig_17032_g4142
MAARLDRAAGERMFFMGRVASPAARDNGGGEADGDGDGSGCGGNGAPGVLAPFVVTGLSGSVYTIHLSTEEAGPSAADAGGVGIVAKCNCRDYIFRRVGDVGARKLRCGRAATPRVPEADDDCPICYEAFGVVPSAADPAVVYCRRGCGGGVHADCFRRWEANAAGAVTCVYCRAPWGAPPALAAGGAGAAAA